MQDFTAKPYQGYKNIFLNGIEIIPDKPDAWSVLMRRIDIAYGREPSSFGGIRNYYYCGKRLDSMTRDECILALTKFKIPCDDIK